MGILIGSKRLKHSRAVCALTRGNANTPDIVPLREIKLLDGTDWRFVRYDFHEQINSLQADRSSDDQRC